MTQHYRVKNWSSYQSYKDRRPPWIRLHRSLIDDPAFQKMSAEARALLPMLWLLACEDSDPVSGMIRMDYEDIAWRLRIPVDEVTGAINEMQDADFIECIQSVTDPLQDCNSTVPTETEERQRRDRVNTSLIDEGFDEFWSIVPKKADKQAAKKAYKAALKLTTHETLIEQMKKYKKLKEGSEYIKNPATWLRAGSWENEELNNVKAGGLKF